MIKNIKYLKNFGIFQDYSNKNTQDFNKFNLIYGWNGSGKTTLVTLFELLKKKELPNRFSSSEFEVTLDNHQPDKVTQKNLDKSGLNLHIFNENFIKENIDWDSSVKSILLVAEEKIQERKRLNELNEVQKNDNQKKNQQENEIQRLGKEFSSFMTREAKNIKLQLQAIDTSDRYFMNYNKTKLETFINEHEGQIRGKEYLLNKKQVEQNIEGAKPSKKDNIPLVLDLYKLEFFNKKEGEISTLLEKNIINKAIKKLVSNIDIQSWVEEGLKIYNKHQLEKCGFCENVISQERITELENHFSKDYENFKESLNKLLQSVDDYFIQLKNKLPESEKLYVEYKQDFVRQSQTLFENVEEINTIIEKWKESIKKKIKDPFDTSFNVETISELLITNLNKCIEGIIDIINQHNTKTSNFEKETQKRKEKLEGHYITEKVIDFKYFHKIETLKEHKKQFDALNLKMSNRKKKIQSLESSLSNEGIGATKINSYLHKFLGRNNLSLQFNKEKKGYDIIRDDIEGEHSKNLSEGEKRAIAFIYFITKLVEKSNQIKDSIVIIDDPISSFDSNNLFHAYSFLRSHCRDVQQLFVFTHNFTYFKLVRDWFFKNNEYRKKQKQPIKAHFFVITAISSLPKRCSILEKAPASLVQYNSEYHYIFEKLWKYKQKDKLDIHGAFLTANLSRKLLESFFYFKYPKHRADMSSLLDAGSKNCKSINSQTKEKIYNFINKYSHSDKIEFNEDSSENLMGESYNIVKDIFKWIEEVDEVHYKEMVEVIEKN